MLTVWALREEPDDERVQDTKKLRLTNKDIRQRKQTRRNDACTQTLLKESDKTLLIDADSMKQAGKITSCQTS